jgi:hypothetical protein
MWLWRDGTPSKLTVKNYNYYLGADATNAQRQDLQAYWLQLQTEWLRAERALAGVFHFCYLTNNYGFTGDDFTGSIAELRPAPIFTWFRHCFAPTAVFIDLTDERYMKHVPPHPPGSTLALDLIGVNDPGLSASGQVVLRLLDSQGKEVLRQTKPIQIPPYGSQTLPVSLRLPGKADGYLLVAEYTPKGAVKVAPVLSRRYVKVGQPGQSYRFHELTGKE